MSSSRGSSGTQSGRGVPRAKIPEGQDDERFSSSLSKLQGSLHAVNNTTLLNYGVCPGCNKQVLGDMLKAFGKTYHPEHFQCKKCRSTIRTDNFYEVDGNPMCDKCYQTGGQVVCAHCKKTIVGKVTTALGKSYHPGHFQCTMCQTPLDGVPFMEVEGKVYCEKDYNSMFGSNCAECGQPVEGECMQEGDKYWHPHHFKCTFCHKLIEGDTYFMVGGKLCCEADYAVEGAYHMCGKCGKGITGEYLEALGQYWHTQHFMCAFCSRKLAGLDFNEDNGQAYCVDCSEKLFS